MTESAPDFLEMAARLIGEPSVSSTRPELDQSNQGVIDLLANWLDPLGFETEIIPVANRPGKSNLIARLGSGSDGLLLSGHTDTVPFDEHLWRSDPFRVKERDDRLFGLGSCDMKSFFAIAIEAARPLLDRPLQRPLVILATADEESTMSGARQLLRRHVPDVSHAIIGEPTDMQPVTRHKGITMARLRVTGASGHSSDPSLGVNAIEGMHEALTELMSYRQELQGKYRDSRFHVAWPTMNFGCIHGGDNPNRICDHAELSFDLRNPPSMDMQGFIQALEARVRSRLGDSGFEVGVELLHDLVPAFENADSALAPVLEKMTGQSCGAAAFGTEAPFLRALGLDVVVMGPGSISVAHQPNEYLPLAQVKPAIDLIRNLIGDRCLRETPALLL